MVANLACYLNIQKLKGILYIDSSVAVNNGCRMKRRVPLRRGAFKFLYNVLVFVFLFDQYVLFKISLSHPVECFLERKIPTYLHLEKESLYRPCKSFDYTETTHST